MRWGVGELLANTWSSFYIGQKNVAYDTNGDGVKDLMVCDTKPSSTTTGVYYIDLSKSPYYTFDKGKLYITNENYWQDNKYLQSIPRAALVKIPTSNKILDAMLPYNFYDRVCTDIMLCQLTSCSKDEDSFVLRSDSELHISYASA
jgi:hypothetical protein